jgi:hypothetical protein
MGKICVLLEKEDNFQFYLPPTTAMSESGQNIGLASEMMPSSASGPKEFLGMNIFFIIDQRPPWCSVIGYPLWQPLSQSLKAQT